MIKKTGISEQFRDSENVIPVDLIKTIGDKVLLKNDEDIYRYVKRRNFRAFISLLRNRYPHKTLSKHLEIEELKNDLKLSSLFNVYSKMDALINYTLIKYYSWRNK